MPPDVKIPNNTEIDQALKEFEMKSGAEQVQKTDEVSGLSEAPRMIRLVIKYSGGLIKERKEAEVFLLIVVIINIIITLVIIFK